MSRYYWMQREDMNFHVTHDEHPDPANFERHCHNHYELIYVTQGAGRYVVEGCRYPLKPETLFLFRPGEFHYVDVAEDKPYSRYVIHFEASAVSVEVRPLLSQLEKRSEEGNFYDSAELPLVVTGAFERLNAIRRMPEDKGELLARLILSEIIVSLSVALPSKPEAAEPLGLRVVRYLNDHLTEKIALEELAKHFFVSKYYICRAFRAHNGVSILKYLTEKRVYLAHQLMCQGETAVSAAMEAGFGDYSSFYRAYLRIFGTAPSGREVKEKHKDHE